VQSLPIDGYLPEIVETVQRDRALVLVAEPGAGKTTRVPRALLDAGVAEILVLEPRRIAARMAARRVADELGERPGDRVGYQVRFEDVTSGKTKLRFLTEAILTRRFAADRELRGVRAVVFDEFHERHLHSDLGLALARDLRRTRPDLAIVVMSATLDAEPLAKFLECKTLSVPGRTHEVAVEYASPEDRPLEDNVRRAVRDLVDRGLDGHVLVFLPGAAEIRRCLESCAELARRENLELVALHGDLPAKEQDAAVAPSARPKIILATNVAETSITIDGVVAVIDGGLARVPRHSPWSGLSVLETKPVSKASVVQRSGRAGRTRPGRAIRLFTKHDYDGRAPHERPEIARSDLAELALTMFALGRDPSSFPFFEAPPPAAIDSAVELLSRLGAIEDRALTDLGKRLLAMPVHPRLGRLMVEAERRGIARDGATIAALLGERDVRLAARARFGEHSRDLVASRSDVLDRLEAFEHRTDVDRNAVRAVERARDKLESHVRAPRREDEPASAAAYEEAVMISVLSGFPDRVAKRRSKTGDEIVFAAGGAGSLARESSVRDAELVVAVEAEERNGRVLVRTASEVEPEWLLELAPERVEERSTLSFDARTERVVRVRGLYYEKLALEESTEHAPSPDAGPVLYDALVRRGFDAVFDMGEVVGLQNRLAFAGAHDPSLAPSTAIDHAVRALTEHATSFEELRRQSLSSAVLESLDPKALARLEHIAPLTVRLPGVANAAIAYESDRPPWIAARIQDFFGLSDGPKLANGKVPLVLHILAPNDRPIQVTSDLAGFWDRHYPTLKKELARRYPKHFFPEDPRSAPAKRLVRRVKEG
jgi:ATP-dependent helicase HrpB